MTDTFIVVSSAPGLLSDDADQNLYLVVRVSDGVAFARCVTDVHAELIADALNA